MATFADRQRKNREANRPAIKFNQRDDMRDFARSAHGQNYNRMMDIQRQLPNMDRNDPMVQEFKDRRRTLNRYGKNPMGEMLGYTPHEMMDKYVDLSRDVRQTNKPVYNKMYPLTGGFMNYMDQGATLGMLKNAATDILSNVGIGGALDTNEEELRNYANLTYPQDVHPGPTYYERPEELEDYEDDPNAPIQRIQEEIYAGPRPHEGMPYLSDEAAAIQKEFNTNPYFKNLQDPNVVLPFEKDRRGHPHLETYTPDAGPRLGTASPHDFSEGIRVDPKYERWLTDTSDEDLLGMAPSDDLSTETLPFDDSARERAIMEQYPESFIGPPIDPSWRPVMMDVAGKGINRGLFPYPGYNEEVTVAPPPFYGGRGEMPGRDSPYYYDRMREGYEFGNLINEDDGASFFDTTKKKFKNRDEYNDWLNMKRQYGLR